jgi:hypothetical protein
VGNMGERGREIEEGNTRKGERNGRNRG